MLKGKYEFGDFGKYLVSPWDIKGLVGSLVIMACAVNL